MEFQLPYYKGTLPLHVPDGNLKHVLVNHADRFRSGRGEADLVRDALKAPIGTPPLSELAKGKRRILVITSDHTRNMPSGITMPLLLEEIRRGLYERTKGEARKPSGIREQLGEVMNSLTEREKQVLILRFGLADGRARTLEEVGRVFEVTRERIRQIEAKALRKLRHPSRSKKLKDYLEE